MIPCRPTRTRSSFQHSMAFLDGSFFLQPLRFHVWATAVTSSISGKAGDGGNCIMSDMGGLVDITTRRWWLRDWSSQLDCDGNGSQRCGELQAYSSRLHLKELVSEIQQIVNNNYNGMGRIRLTVEMQGWKRTTTQLNGMSVLKKLCNVSSTWQRVFASSPL